MARLGPLLSPVLVGRDDLLDQAERRVADAAAGRGRLILLAGGAGIGKSRLIASIGRKARAAGFHVADGLVSPADADVPAASILDLARTMLRIDHLQTIGAAILERARQATDLTQGRRRAYVHDLADAILNGLDGLHEPAYLWFDDLQWADEISLDVIAELARVAMERPLLIVGAYRSDEVAAGSLLRGWRSRLLAQRMAEEARLVPLTPEETGQMASVIIGGPVPREVVEALYERTDGIPLHVEELLGALEEPDRLDARAIRNSAVPQTLEDAILARIGRLTPEAQAVARAGAVIGRCFVPEVLAGIMDRPLAEMDAPLAELIDHDVVDAGGPRGLMDFRHQLLRDAMYRSVPPAELRRFHARAAEFGRALEGASEVHASVHYERAGMRAEAYRSALAGARSAAGVLAHREAFDLFARAIDNLPDALADADVGAILLEAADSAAAREEMAAFERWILEAQRRYEGAGDHIGVARAILGLATLERRNAGPNGPRRASVEAVLAELDQVPDSPDVRALRCDAWYMAGVAAIDARDLGRAADAADWAMGEALAEGSAALVGRCESLQGLVDILRGDIATGRRRIEAEARRALAAGDGDAAITAFRWGGDILVQALDYRGALDFIDEGIRYADSIEQSYCPGILSSDAATIAWADGRWPEAEHRAREVIALRGSARAPGMARLPLAFVALGRGDLAAARRLAAEAVTFGERGGAPDILVSALWAQAEIALIARDPGAALEPAERALSLAEGSDERAQAAPLVVSGVRALLAAGRPADAQRWLDRVAALLDGTPWASLPAVGHARGLIALSEGSTGIARSALERAVAGWDAMPRVWEALWARCDLAAVHLRTGRYAEAASLIGDVRERATALDSRPLLERADELARNTRGHASTEAAWHPLTGRELEVARCIATGMTNNEVAAELGIAPKTASAHVEHILAKLGASRRTEIAAWVTTLGDSGPQRAASRSSGGQPVRR